MIVFSYRNLHKKGVVWSIKDWKTKKVVDYATEVFFENVELKVSEAGRQRVLREKQKNVHAGVKGTRLDKEPLCEWVKASYNPYKEDSFISEGKKVHMARYAKLTQEGLFISKDFMYEFSDVLCSFERPE
jgi:hypothetical protein